ncbi:NADP-dependent oxidoreductase [Dermatophilus congolensis]|uniref:NADP-dependent oxidoreductase n=1 Tax=Dermatophilus congolensis TaxID=1863 RepID=UPI001AAECB7C|nr:NADP-dependent oxidoreductase [Dermatophilus congolensis]MBO3128696.1 NADP-dependent oxidoreductase [Dermatophilus congolensis]MBO3132667.1 NADP-dependent oxidoreductase [Dermatophilus congolensis]MBO3133172.1 NADP-dependent oxidoreductase [Dermatophilus congolensis]MBO3135407.1 NADP-dependent oxidoreductase [Dermatophilus congolensis]MBO3137648.1 NADP-dependent oxidoreductase [Dermatophilus congolensis]
MPTTTRVFLAQYPNGEPTDEDLRIEETQLTTPEPGQALLQTLSLSLDPYMRGRMSQAESYFPPLELGSTIVGGTVSRVLECPGGELTPGDLVLGYGGWQTHSVENVAHLTRLDPDKAPPSTALGILGMPGFTAYAGLLLLGKPRPGETVAVAAATGPVGSAVGQIARIHGARAVGVAGGEAKTAYLKELGFDAALDHRSSTFAEDLATATPDGIDVYFENVGGHVFDAVLPRMNTYGRIPLCGLVSGYNSTDLPAGPDRSSQLMGTILKKSLTVRGFIQTEFQKDHYSDFLRDMTTWINEGKIQYKEDIVEGLENSREAFRGLLTGKNFGKLIIHVAE